MFFRNQNIFNALSEVIPEGVIITNKKQIIVAVNQSVENIFNYKKDELINQHLNILIPTGYKTDHKKHFVNFLKKNDSRKMNNNLDLYGVTKNNTKVPLEIALKPFNINNELYVLALILDITSRKKIEQKITNLNLELEKTVKKRTLELKKTIEQLKDLNFNFKKEIKKRIEVQNKIKNALKKEQELNSLKTKFLSLVSHEFKTPLSGILTSTMLLKKYQSSDQQDKRDKHIDTISSKVHYLNNILNDFLSIERLDSSKVKYKFTRFNLGKIVNEVVYNANMLLKNGQRINISSNINEYVLYQDEKILELLLSNLLYNAIKYSPENKTITLEVFKNNKNFIFKITDEGIGIPKKDQKFIFNRYFRAENVLNTQGTGIGLNIVKSHIKNLGGTISFTSQENKGSVFTVELPIIKLS